MFFGLDVDFGIGFGFGFGCKGLMVGCGNHGGKGQVRGAASGVDALRIARDDECEERGDGYIFVRRRARAFFVDEH